MSDNPISSSNNVPSDTVLLRIFHCMTHGEQEELFENALQILGRRNSFDPYYARRRPEDIQFELGSENINDRLMIAWPGEWPGREIVDLDDVGDPGAWLQNLLPEDPIRCLFPPGNEETIAEVLAEDYLYEIRRAGFELPSDFGDNPNYEGWTEEDEEQVRAEFVAFLKHWRDLILTTLKKQNPPERGGNA